MAQSKKRESYNALKDYDGQKYTGMNIGGRHIWNYTNAIWDETKVSPDKWDIKLTSLKTRSHRAPPRTGALERTQYHWYIVADQKVVKLDENSYSTTMTGVKFKIGYKKPTWNQWSYRYQHETYEDKIIKILEETIERLKVRKKQNELLSFLS
ncbi:MAG: hypothetical protein EU536_00755 [Promethearchaeota archaeon]|nr:MAG: hypothetical protein EU536_00755 [Candidatus Lokiarchaeota archaeon]